MDIYPQVPGADHIVRGLPNRFGGSRAVGVHLMPIYPDGHMYFVGMSDLIIGTQPLSEIEEAKREARMIVREGMKDILEWLGPKAPGGSRWDNEPSGVELLERIRKGADILSPTITRTIRAAQ